jgi:hypothetical protein
VFRDPVPKSNTALHCTLARSPAPSSPGRTKSSPRDVNADRARRGNYNFGGCLAGTGRVRTAKL